MSASVQGVANLAADLIVRSVQKVPVPQSAPVVASGEGAHRPRSLPTRLRWTRITWT